MLRRAVLVACCILWMIPTAARRSVQATINEQFAALAEKGLAPITTSSELRAQLKPSELCYAADNLPALSRLSIPRCDPIERQAMSNALQLEVAEKNRCWAAQPSTAPPPAAANMMSTDGRSSIAAAPPAEASFETLLARWRLRPAALAALDTTPPVPHARQVLLVGDSTMRMMASALTCNLLRRLGPHESMEADGWNIEYLPFMAYQPGFKSSEAARAAFENRLRALSASGGVVVLGIGLHYNNAEPMTRNTVVEFREAMYYGAQGRPEYHRDLVHFLGRLDEYARSHQHAHSFVMTPLVQHFNTSDGAYAPTVQATADQLSPGAFPCVPLQQSPSPATSPNSWRAADLLQASAPFNASITVIPFHALTARLHQFHPGNVAKTHERKTSVDCSHLRYTPWLYEPVWSAILQTVNAAAPTPGPPSPPPMRPK